MQACPLRSLKRLDYSFYNFQGSFQLLKGGVVFSVYIEYVDVVRDSLKTLIKCFSQLANITIPTILPPTYDFTQSPSLSLKERIDQFCGLH